MFLILRIGVHYYIRHRLFYGKMNIERVLNGQIKLLRNFLEKDSHTFYLFYPVSHHQSSGIFFLNLIQAAAQDGDIIVLAGKGHEDYQEIKGIKQPMDERELIADIIKENPNIKL